MKRTIITTVRICFYLSAAGAAIFLTLYLLTIGNYSVPMTVSDDPSLSQVEINGRMLHAEAFGSPSNPVVVIVHGGPGWDYRGLLPLKQLSDQYQVVFYDQLGTGLSSRADPVDLTLESALHDLDSIIDHFGKGDQVDLIGHSWGAMLVSGYLGRHPEKVRHAVLAEPGFLTTEMMKISGVRFGPRWDAEFLLRAAKAWFQSLHIKGPDNDAASDYFIGQVAPYANPEYYCKGKVPDAAALHWRAGAQAAQAILRSAMDNDGKIHIDLIKRVERFKSPVLFLTSECNQLTGRQHQEKQVKFFPVVRTVVVKGSGHSMFGEKPAESIEIVREYLKAN
ncbi:MAG: alpha/beta hydrolase [Nitrospirae bacterium]|nr:alpha/beta hydrolase [Nitrospirota bacterium]